jgi:tetratricopeptide (TPR) repeat protein
MRDPGNPSSVHYLTPPAEPLRPVALFACALAIVVAALLVYHNTFDCPFVFDDEFSIVKNPSIRSERFIDALFSQPGSGNPVQGRPVLNLTFAINYALGGLNVSGYHVFNLAIHILAALLLFGIIRRTLQTSAVSERLRRRATATAFATALLWTVHPLATNAVTYMTQRAESLAAVFYLLTLFCVVRSAVSMRRYAVIVWSGAAVTACALGMATKEVMASAPLVVFLFDGIFLSSSFKSALKNRWPLYGALAITWIVLAVFVIGAKGRGGTAGFGIGVASLQYAATQLWAIVHYLQLCIRPSPLVLDYGVMSASLSEVELSGIIIVALAVAVLFAWRHHKPLAFAGIFIFAVLAPSSSIVPITTQTVAEHRMYLPLAAVVLLVVLGASYAFDAIAAQIRFMPSSFLPALRGTLLLVAAIVLGCLTVARNSNYKSERSIWQDTVDKRPQNVRAETYLGACLINQDQGNPSEASLTQSLGIFTRALAIDSTYALAYANRGLAYYRLKRFNEALQDYDKALSAQSNQGNRAEMFNNRGILLGEQGRTDRAIADFNAALTINPSYASAHNNLGSAYANLAKTLMSSGDSADASADYLKAIGCFTDAIKNDPNIIPPHRGRAAACAKLGIFSEAADDCSAIIRLNPADAVAYGDRAICFYQLKKYDAAREDVRMCENKGGLPNGELVRLLGWEMGSLK